MFCVKCGNALFQSSGFCKNCGHRTVPRQQSAPAASFQGQGGGFPGAPRSAPSSKRKLPIVVAIVALVLVAAFIFNPGNSGRNPLVGGWEQMADRVQIVFNRDGTGRISDDFSMSDFRWTVTDRNMLALEISEPNNPANVEEVLMEFDITTNAAGEEILTMTVVAGAPAETVSFRRIS